MKHWAITAFVEAHQEWKGAASILSIKQKSGWCYIYFHGSEIGRVKKSHKGIIAESFVSK